MSVTIIDVLEPIEIDDREAQGSAVAFTASILFACGYPDNQTG